MSFTRAPAGDDPQWPRASSWADGSASMAAAGAPRLRLVGVPSSVGSISASEAWRTPPAIRAALQRLSTWDPERGLDLLETVRCEDLGDWPVAELPLEAAMNEIRERAADLALTAGTHVFLGGDNAITRPVVAGLHGPDLGRVGVITLDAHHDVRHLDDGPRNGSPIRGLLEDGVVGEHVAQIGLGRFTNSAPYAAWCREQGIHVTTAPAAHAQGIDTAVHEALAAIGDVATIHVDLDIDVLDVAHAPACPGARPGGLHPEQLFRAVELLVADRRVVSWDVTEVDAAADHEGRTVMAAAMAVLTIAAGVAGRG